MQSYKYALASALSACLLASCQGASQNPWVPLPYSSQQSKADMNANALQSPQSLAPPALGPLSKGATSVYVASNQAYTISAYHTRGAKNRRPYCTVFGQTYVTSIGVDGSGKLWVPGFKYGYYTYGTASYAPNCGKQGITLQDSSQPLGIAFGNMGTNYVLEGADDVAVFKKGQTVASDSLLLPSYVEPAGIGADQKGNVFASFEEASEGQVVEFVAGKNPGVILPAVTLGFPGASILFDKKLNMIIPDNMNNSLSIWKPPYNGKPKSFPLKGTPWQCSLSPEETRIVCTNYSGSIDFYYYPSMQYEFSISRDLYRSKYVSGVAYDPAAP